MATSKTLTPTNVTIQIPAFTDKPDQRVNSNCIDKSADAINALSDQIANLLIVESVNCDSDTVAVNSNKTFSKSVAKTGYTALGIIGIVSFTSSAVIVEYGMSNATNAFVNVRNVGSESITGYPALKVLYKKNS